MAATRQTLLVAGVGASGAALVRSLRDTWDIVAVDVDPAAIAALEGEAPGTGRAALALHVGDATSALVLRRAGAAGARLAVACAGSDEVNLEIGRVLAAELGVARRVGLLCDPRNEPQYVAAGMETVSRAHACAINLGSLIQRGHRVAQGVGLGAGEILEVEVLPISPVVRRPLKDLHPKRWLVGAVFRGGSLIIPHGETILAAGDRVLIIGEPAILPAIAMLIRTGESEFPLQYGTHLVALGEAGLAAAVPEIAYLLEGTKAELLEIVSCAGEGGAVAEVLAACARRGVAAVTSCGAGKDFESLARHGAQRDVGLFVQAPERMGPLARLGLARTRIGRALALLESPCLVPRGTFPYRRVLLALTELPFPDEALLLAVDVVRMLGAELAIAAVHQPEIVVGLAAREALAARHRELIELAAVYHVTARPLELSGNPVRTLVEASREHDLVVVPYEKARRRSVVRPDVALHVVHRARCSAMAMPY